MQQIQLSICRLTSWNRTDLRSKFIPLCSILIPFLFVHSEEVPIGIAVNRAVKFAQIDILEQAAADEAKGFQESAALISNPSFFYERENLRGSNRADDSRETTTGISAPLDFIWKRSTRIDSAQLKGEVTAYQIEDQRRHTVREVSLVFAQYAANRLEHERHEAAHVALDRAREFAKAAVDSGDVSPSLFQRVNLAVSRHAFHENRITSQQLDILSRFSQLTGVEGSIPSISDMDWMVHSFSERDNVREIALLNRPDLKAAKAMHEWKRSERKLSQKEGMPELSLEAAHMEDNRGRDGLFLGLAVEIPLFDRNQGAVSRAHAEAVRAEVAYHQAVRLIKGQAVFAYDRWQQVSKAWQDINELGAASDNAATLLNITAVRFEAGETSLLEYLDTVEAYLEISEEEIELQKSLRIAAIDLAYVTATSTTHP